MTDISYRGVSEDVGFVVLIALFVLAVGITFERAIRDGDVSWGGLIGMLAAGLIGWALLAQRYVVR